MRRKIILASQSPRRRELMVLCDIPFMNVYPNCKEVFKKDVTIEEAIESVAQQKAKAVFDLYPEAAVIGADTVVVSENHVMGKPKNEAEAFSMLKQLSGKVHQVITGVCIMSPEETLTYHSITDVEFYPLSDEEINEYIKSERPFDKAGAYGIQDKGCTLVKRINGDFYTVVGLPIASVVKNIRKYI